MKSLIIILLIGLMSCSNSYAWGKLEQGILWGVGGTIILNELTNNRKHNHENDYYDNQRYDRHNNNGYDNDYDNQRYDRKYNHNHKKSCNRQTWEIIQIWDPYEGCYINRRVRID